MTESDDTAGLRVTHFINTGADWGFDVTADLRVRKSFPAAPGLYHYDKSSMHFTEVRIST
jgi:hypothetical protein